MIVLGTKSGKREAATGKRQTASGKRLAAGASALVCAILIVAACHRDKTATTAVTQSIDDATISTRVKTALLNEPGVSFTRVDVETDHGVVTLTGTVKSKEEEQKVIAVTRGVKGVRDVKSSLQIQPQ